MGASWLGAAPETRGQTGRGCFGRGGEGCDERERLDGFTESHFVGEDTAEFVAMQVVQPSGTEFLIRTEEVVERGGHGGRGNGREIAERGTAVAPAGGGFKTGRERFEQVIDLGGAGSGDAVGLEGATGGGLITREGALDGGDLFGAGAIDEEDLFARLDVVATGSDGGGEGSGRGVAGGESEGDIITIGFG